MIEFNFIFTESHLLTGSDRYRKQSRFRLLRIAIQLISSIFLVIFSIYGLINSWYLLSAFMLFLVFMPFLFAKLERPIAKYKFRKTPYINSEIEIVISDKGFQSSDKQATINMEWGAITKVRRFSDGFMFFTGPVVYYWCPDANMSCGTSTELEQLINSNITDFKYV